jgi:methionyl-tRNA formyltransferase
MATSLINCILLSEKSWHKALFENLKTRTAEICWYRIDNKEQFTAENVNKIEPAWIFIPHWSYKIKPEIFENYNCVVFHMTDLPFGRGGSPLQNLIVNGYESTKISALKVGEGIDTGDIYLKRPLSLSGTAEEIFVRASAIIEDMILEIINSKTAPEAQTGDVTVFRRRTPEESDISGLTDLKKVYDFIRMLDAEGYPNAYAEIGNFRFEFSSASFTGNNSILANVRITKK